MNVVTPSLRPGARSLPAELMIPRQYRKVDWGTQRLLAGGVDRMQSAGGVRGLMGLGDCMIADQVMGICPDGSDYLGTMDSGGAATGTTTTTTPTVVPAGSTSFDWNAMAGMITVSSTSLAKILAAQNPGTYYKDPQGNVIYTQPTGNTQNLPGIYGSTGGFGGGAQGTINTGFGSATFGGVSSSTLMMGAVLLFAFMMMSRGR